MEDYYSELLLRIQGSDRPLVVHVGLTGWARGGVRSGSRHRFRRRQMEVVFLLLFFFIEDS